MACRSAGERAAHLGEEGGEEGVGRVRVDPQRLDVAVVDVADVPARAGDDLGGVTHTAPSKYHDEIIPLAFIHTNMESPY